MIERRTGTPVEPAFSHFYDFPFDVFQLEAMEHIRDGRSVMVAAPTSSGKTVVAEYALWRAMELRGRAIYTTPIKALSNQKRRDLEALFPGKVGLLTGDRSESPDAPIVVMTTEVLRNMLVEDSSALDWVTCVVFDEVHYLADRDRGTIWEEAIISCPRHIQLVCLSATIANAEEIANWISQTHRETSLVRHDERPVPLEHFYYTQNKLHLVRDEWGERRAMFPREGRLPAPEPADVVRAMRRAGLLPAIWFAFSRRAVEEAAERCVMASPRPGTEAAEAIERAVTWTLSGLPEEDRRLPQLTTLIRLLRGGVGFHHAGLLPPLKELVERLFADGYLSVVCATDTLAVGINMPARTVVISSLSRPHGSVLTPNDFQQLTGRAGRRGIDRRGAAVILPSGYDIFEQSYREVSAPLEPVLSAFQLRYSTLLSAMEGSEDRLSTLIRSSLRQYQMKARARRAAIELEDLGGSLDGEVDDQDGLIDFLALQSRLSSADKEQRRARNARTKSRGSEAASRRLDRARRQQKQLSELLHVHPSHEVARELEGSDPEKLATLRRMARLRGTIQQAEQESEEAVERIATSVRAVLSRLGYLRKGTLTRKAQGLREIQSLSGIVLSEMYARRAFDDVDAAELAEAISWFASDADRRRRNSYRLPSHLNWLRREAISTFSRIWGLEQAEGIELAQGPSAWFWGVAYAWCRGATVGQITTQIELGEGDVVSLLNKTVDLLDQFEGMVRRLEDPHMLATCREAKRLLVRGLVAMVRSGDVQAG